MVVTDTVRVIMTGNISCCCHVMSNAKVAGVSLVCHSHDDADYHKHHKQHVEHMDSAA